MDKRDVMEFFDRLAPDWDASLVERDAVINKILDNAGIGPGMDVLDVACGTGVLFPFYIERGVGSVTGIDLSAEMARIASEKYAGRPEIEVIRGDVEEYAFDRKFDAAVVYNAFPHFPEPRRLIKTLASLLRDGGTVTIAHGMSREQINRHHSDTARQVSQGLMPAGELKELLEPYFEVKTVISDNEMYQLSGTKI